MKKLQIKTRRICRSVFFCLRIAAIFSAWPVCAQLDIKMFDSRPPVELVQASPLVYWVEPLDRQRPIRLHVLAINLRNPSVELDVVAGAGHDSQGPARSVLDDPLSLLKGHNILAAINANTCAPIAGKGLSETNVVLRRRLPVTVLGWAQSAQGMISPPKNLYVSFWIDPAGYGRMGSLLHPVSASMAVSGIARLLSEGKTMAFADSHPHARTALGIDSEGRQVWLIVAEGGAHNTGEGIIQVELADFMLKLGCCNAIELGSGPESAMFLKKGDSFRQINRSSGGNRLLSVLLVVRERSRIPASAGTILKAPSSLK